MIEVAACGCLVWFGETLLLLGFKLMFSAVEQIATLVMGSSLI
jgi:hypothetical protein